jgi:cysteine desulfurase
MVYLDHGATTPVHKQIIRSLASWGEDFFNPSSANSQSYKVKNLIEDCRHQIAKTLEVSPCEIFFTSGGTEGDNWILNSWHETTSKEHIIITDNIEHAAVMNTCAHLAKTYGRDIVTLSVDEYGKVPTDFIEKLAQKGDLIAVMGANNEIGTVQDLSKIGRIAQEVGAYFFSDCVQLYPHRFIAPRQMGIDALSVSAHKFGGLKGTGFVYVSKRMQDDGKLVPFMHGGGQEDGLRAGTENIIGILAMSKAVQITQENMAVNERICTKLKQRLLAGIEREIPDIKINSANTDVLDTCLNVSFLGCDNQQLMALLDSAGIIVSAGSACHAGSSEPSHVLKAIGLTDAEANSAIRFTLGAESSLIDMDYTVQMLKQSVEMLRGM